MTYLLFKTFGKTILNLTNRHLVSGQTAYIKFWLYRSGFHSMSYTITGGAACNEEVKPKT